MIEIQMVVQNSKTQKFESYLKDICGCIIKSLIRGDFHIYQISIPKTKEKEVLDLQLEFL